MSFDYTSNYNRVRSIGNRDVNEFLCEVLGPRFRKYREDWDRTNRDRATTEFPLYLVLEQQYRCNLRCPMCLIPYPEKRMFNVPEAVMPDDIFEKVMAEAEQWGCPSISMNNTEEPLLNKKVFERIQRARRAGFVDVFMNTNGVLLDADRAERLIDSGLTRLLIGFDGHTKEVYEKVRKGANFEQVKANVERFLEIREKKNSLFPLVRLSFVVSEVNQHELEAFKEYWMGRVDYLAIQEYQMPPVQNPELRGVALPGTTTIYDCDQPFNRMIIRPNGDVNPCCSFWAYTLNLGSVREKSVHEIWHSEGFNKIRESFRAGKDLEKTCVNCLENQPLHVESVSDK